MVGIMGGGVSYAGTRRVMVFIDGGHLRSGLREMLGNDNLNYSHLLDRIRGSIAVPSLHDELVRAYYYDATPSPEEAEKHKQQREYLRKIKDCSDYEIREGRLKKDGKGSFKQKGVDTLIALDMLSKAYENHYDVAILIAGDDD